MSARFWSLFLSGHETKHIVENLDEGHCSRPLSLYNICKRISEEDFCRRLKAPEVVSIDVVENLPAELRKQNVYVVRLGQYHTGRAAFIICRASPGYVKEALRSDDITRASSLGEISDLPPWVSSLARQMGVEALASIAALELIRILEGGSGPVYTIPSLRFGHIEFKFQPSPRSSTYSYSGQVEIDAVLGRSSVYALEAKTITRTIRSHDHIVVRRYSVFKYKIAFSAQALAEILNHEVRPVIAFIDEHKGSLRAVAALLEPPARPGQPYPVTNMNPVFRLVIRF